MRLIVVGAGAIGGTIAARVFQSGQDVVVVARGEHASAVRAHGLRLETPAESVTLPIPVVDGIDALDLIPGDVLLLAVKSQDTAEALQSLSHLNQPDLAIACAQNGVANEPLALRFFERVYGVLVMSPTAYLEPGVVQAYSTPVTGILDVGRYPEGLDETTRRLCALFLSSTYASQEHTNIMSWKHGKLLANLTNAIEVVCGTTGSRRGGVAALAMEEGRQCLSAAGITVEEEVDQAWSEHLALGSIGSQPRPGSSMLQSLRRHKTVTEVDYLNGEIVRMGRELGIPTPVNEFLQHTVTRMAQDGRSPGLFTEEELLGHIRRATA
jgi:2-dehydropantoate 2-reductase